MVIPAVESTHNLLASAKSTPTVRRVVTTSSLVAIVPWSILSGGPSLTSHTGASRVTPLPRHGPYSSSDAVEAYAASKALALGEIDRFLVEEKPDFTIVNIMPGLVLGPNALYKTAEEMTADGASNAMILRLVLGVKSTTGFPRYLIGLSDVVRVHLAALDEGIVKESASFPLDAHRPSFDEVKEIARRHFPAAVDQGVFLPDGVLPGGAAVIDTTETVKTFGPLDSYEKDVVALLQQYLDLKNHQPESTKWQWLY
jgi:nucleoside-diphosphate-sugar epimerase